MVRLQKWVPWLLIMTLEVPNLEKMFATNKEETTEEELVLVAISSTDLDAEIYVLKLVVCSLKSYFIQ